MRWIPRFAGKLAGGLLGYSLTGWPGMVIGALLGHSFDLRRDSLWQIGPRLFARRRLARDERLFRDHLFTCLGHLARLDGQVTPEAIEAAEKLFRQFKLNSNERNIAIHCFNLGKLPNTDPEPLVRQVCQRYASSPARRLEWISNCLPLVFAGDGPRKAQLQTLRHWLPLLKIQPQAFERLLQPYLRAAKQTQKPPTPKTSPLHEAYLQLGVQPGCSYDTARKAYRKLMSQYHPDKLESQQLTDYQRRQGKARAQGIQQAWAEIKKHLKK